MSNKIFPSQNNCRIIAIDFNTTKTEDRLPPEELPAEDLPTAD